jgi:hypothetical protein
MSSQHFNTATTDSTPHLRKSIAAPCPDCETRFPLQLLLAELLGKNQALRMQLQQAQSQLARASESVFGQELVEEVAD